MKPLRYLLALIKLQIFYKSYRKPNWNKISAPNFVDREPPWVSWVQFNCAIVSFCDPNLFSRGYFLGLKLFLRGIFWVHHLFSWEFHGSKTFSYGYFVNLKFFLVRISWSNIFFLVGVPWIQFFFLLLISWLKDLQLVAAWEKVTGNRNTEIHHNRVFYSKSISRIVCLLCFIRNMLHVLN